jgi:hypothetical protein
MSLNLPSSDLGLARTYFNSLPSDHAARRYYEGAKYHSPRGVLSKIYHSLFVQQKQFEEMTKFYPYQNTVVATKEEWEA